jgi:ribulose-5-phosphate 4-epimerase/fuculose-1-phosphate aldolase
MTSRVGEKKSVLVTGCSGRVGSAVCQALSSNGHDVVGLDMSEPPKCWGGISFIKGALGPDTLALITFNTFDAIIHLAATPDDADFEGQLLQPNIVGLSQMLSACGDKVPLVMLGSSGKVHHGHDGGYPITPLTPTAPVDMYGATKLFAEAAGSQHSRRYKVQVAAIRIAWCPRTPADCDAMEQVDASGQGRDEYLCPSDAGRFFVQAVETIQPTSRYDLVFLQSKPFSSPSAARFDMLPAKQLCGFEPLAVWPQGIDNIRTDIEYVSRHGERLGRLFGRVEAVPSSVPAEKKRKLCENGNPSGSTECTKTAPTRSAEEIEMRIELAAAYRVFAMLGWEHVIHTHITVKVKGEEEGQELFLINPYGLMFDEITAGSIVKVEAGGRIVDPGDTSYGINPAGFKIHSALHTSKRGKGDGADILCTMHTHHADTIAVASSKQGLLPLSTFANDLGGAAGGVAYHDFAHATANDEVCQNLVRDLGEHPCRVLLLRNHGDITVGRTIGEAWFLMDNLHKACEVQVKSQAIAGATGQPPLQPPAEVLDENFKIVMDNYTGSPYGALEWKAIKRRMEKQYGMGYKDGAAGRGGGSK